MCLAGKPCNTRRSNHANPKWCMTPGVYADLDKLIRLLKWTQKWTRLLIRPFLWAFHLKAVPLALHLFSNSIFRGDHHMNAKQKMKYKCSRMACASASTISPVRMFSRFPLSTLCFRSFIEVSSKKIQTHPITAKEICQKYCPTLFLP